VASFDKNSFSSDAFSSSAFDIAVDVIVQLTGVSANCVIGDGSIRVIARGAGGPGFRRARVRLNRRLRRRLVITAAGVEANAQVGTGLVDIGFSAGVDDIIGLTEEELTILLAA
jgi:hypothetical protein